MDDKRDETELEDTELDGDLAIDDETAAEVTGGARMHPELKARHQKPGLKDR
ncbi:MAG: hypothetical protein WAL04_18790 [Acidimicrobiales bacterium]|jgi:hypothetical protein